MFGNGQVRRLESLGPVPVLCLDMRIDQNFTVMVASLADAPIVLFGTEQTMQDDYRSMSRFSFGRLMQIVRQAQGAFKNQTSLDGRFPGSSTR